MIGDEPPVRGPEQVRLTEGQASSRFTRAERLGLHQPAHETEALLRTGAVDQAADRASQALTKSGYRGRIENRIRHRNGLPCPIGA